MFIEHSYLGNDFSDFSLRLKVLFDDQNTGNISDFFVSFFKFYTVFKKAKSAIKILVLPSTYIFNSNTHTGFQIG